MTGDVFYRHGDRQKRREVRLHAVEQIGRAFDGNMKLPIRTECAVGGDAPVPPRDRRLR
jgi:hypothetical protein